MDDVALAGVAAGIGRLLCLRLAARCGQVCMRCLHRRELMTLARPPHWGQLCCCGDHCCCGSLPFSLGTPATLAARFPLLLCSSLPSVSPTVVGFAHRPIVPCLLGPSPPDPVSGGGYGRHRRVFALPSPRRHCRTSPLTADSGWSSASYCSPVMLADGSMCVVKAAGVGRRYHRREEVLVVCGYGGCGRDALGFICAVAGAEHGSRDWSTGPVTRGRRAPPPTAVVPAVVYPDGAWLL